MTSTKLTYRGQFWGPIAANVRIRPLDLTGADRRLLALIQLWEDRRRGRSLPDRTDLRPEDMREAMGRIMLIEVGHDPPTLTYRLFGTMIADRMGFDLTGKTVDDMRPTWYRDKIRQDFDRAIAMRQPVASTIEVERRQRLFSYERVVLPLASPDGRVGMLLVASFTRIDGEPIAA